MGVNLNKVTIQSNGKLLITRKHYDEFKVNFLDGKFGNARFGEAFYDHFKLTNLKTNNREVLSNVWAKDGEMAKAFIESVFDISP